MSELKDLPGEKATNFLYRVREEMQILRGRRGDKLDRAITLRDLLDSGLAALRPGVSVPTGSGGLPLIPGPGVETYEVDLTPPTTPTGFSATTSKTSIQVVTAPPIYPQGNGHSRTFVYGVGYTLGEPLPTFANAVKLTEFTGDVSAFPVEPATTYRLWVTWVSNDDVESQPAGGTNGFEATAGLLDDANIAFLTASKIRAGSISVGEHIQSAGYVPISAGWRINGDGTAELSQVTVRGTVFASAGQIGGITIAASAVRAGQTAFNTGSGFHLASNGTFSLGNSGGNRLTWNGSEIEIVSPALVIQNGTGTFSGNLNAVGGTFSGQLSGATGTFSGALTAGTLDVSQLIGQSLQYEAPGVYSATAPPGFTRIRVTCVGAGGGGGGECGGDGFQRDSFGGGGGGGGGFSVATFAISPGSTVTIRVGAAGGGGGGTTNFEASSGAGAAGGVSQVDGYLGSGGGGGGGASNGNFRAQVRGAGGGGGSGNVAAGNPGQLASHTSSPWSGDGKTGAGAFPGFFTPGSVGGAPRFAQYGRGGNGGAAFENSFTESGSAGTHGFVQIEFFNPNGVIIRSDWDTLQSALIRQNIEVV